MSVENTILNVLEDHLRKSSDLIIEEEVKNAQARIRNRLKESVLHITKNVQEYFDIQNDETTVTLSVRLNKLKERCSQ